MKNKKEQEKCEGECCNQSTIKTDQNGALYGMGVVGALVYFYPQMVSLSTFFLSLIKSIFWPAILVFEAMKLLGL